MMLRSFVIAVLAMGLTVSIATASVQSDLESAVKQNKVAFIIITDKGTEGLDQAKQTVALAMQQVKASVLIELDRSDPANSALVTKYRVSGAPVPLILVAAPNGALAGGMIAAQATADKIVAMVPSPKKAEILQVLQSGKAVFVFISRNGMAAQSAGQSTCDLACGQMNGRCAMVAIDMDDPAESNFLKLLKVDPASTQPVTLVVNAQGQITGTYTGAADITLLVQAATKKMGGCCPSTVQNPNASCPPAKK